MHCAYNNRITPNKYYVQCLEVVHINYPITYEQKKEEDDYEYKKKRTKEK